MRTGKSIIAICLTATLAFQMLAPSSEVFAAEVGAVSSFAANIAGGSSSPAPSSDEAPDAGAGDVTPGVDDPEGETAENDGGKTGDSVTSAANAAVSDETAREEADQTDAANEQADENEAAATAEGEWLYNSLEDLKAVLSGGASSVTGSGDTLVITYGSNEDLIAISNTNPELYQNATITKGGYSGDDFDVSTSVGVPFIGFGSDSYPFQGTFDSGDYSIGVARSFYNSAVLSDGNCSPLLTWKGTGSEPVIANKLAGNGKKLTATITVADVKTPGPGETIPSTDPAITSALVGEASGTLTIDATYSFSGNRKGIAIAPATGNAGLLVNTLAAGASLTIKNASEFYDEDGGEPSITAAAGCAGGLVGLADEGATVAVNASVDVSAFTVKAGDSAGGFIGKANNLTLSFAGGATVKPALKVGDANTNYAGGAIGSASFSGPFAVTPSMFSFGDDGGSIVELGTIKRAGGLFGTLDVVNGDVTVQGGPYKSKLVAAGDNRNPSSRGGYGGIAGNVCSSNDANVVHALVVAKNDNDRAAIQIERAANLFYTGGVVGYLGDNTDGVKSKVACVLDGASVTCAGIASAHTGEAKYGGAVGVVDTNEVLDVRDFELIAAGDSAIGKAGTGGSAGIAGSVWEGVVKFSGTTDLSRAQFADNGNTAQLVYQNYNGLIFAAGSGSNQDSELDVTQAKGWKYLRSDAGVTIDDIGDYGEVIRLGSGLSDGLITVGKDTHELTLGKKLQKSGNTYTITSADDFAKLAITVQTSGVRSMVSDSWYGNVLSSTINVNSTIDLAGTGLTGLTRDAATSVAFSGTLTGTGTVNLAVGEPYGMRSGNALGADNTSDGNGKIYRHGRLGLFNEAKGATVSGGVTIGGTMKFDAKNDVDAGALAAVRSDGDASLTGLTVSTAITYDNTSTKTENIGGIFGRVSGAGSIALGSSAVVTAQPTIVSRTNPEEGYSRVASVIGYVEGGSTVTVNASNIKVANSITVSDYKRDTLVGGFIAYIEQGDQKKTVNITGLSFDGFSMTVGANSAAGDSRIKQTSGGLLGYSWGNAIVTIGGDQNSETNYALKTANASVTASNATEFGGLLYAASGYMTVADRAIDLTGATLSASSANKFGVLICRGGSAISGSYIGMDTLSGLYLKNTADWGTAYSVNGTAPAITTSATIFDEWVADTTRPNSKVDEINKNGVISLHTQGEKLNMSGDPANCNSYVNRTAYGQLHKTNSTARYYYNLDRAVAGAGNAGNWITNAEGLLLWSAWRYAPSSVQGYVTQGLASSNTSIQDTLRVNGAIDLTGYSYYPVGNNGANAYLRGTLTFCYQGIAGTEQNNKKNNEKSQHANMHLSILGGFSSASTRNSTLTVGSSDTALTLKGTIGKDVISGGFGSGALISGSLFGNSSSSTIAGVTIDSMGLILDGLTVWTEDAEGLDKGGSSPLLINAMPSYASLTVNKLGVKDGGYDTDAKAATSLFGSLGGEDADMVSASFANISVPSLSSSGIFTHASLLESFGYKQGGMGSANYIFYKDDADKNNVTYGKEIDANDASKNEYIGKQLWYYDETIDGQPAYGHNLGLVKLGDKTASVTNPIFGDYLPYVKKGKEGTAFHEIKVNQRVASIVTGCGTYGDPYVITSAAQINTVSSYINLNTAVDDWEVTIVKDQETLCSRRNGASPDNEITYVYKSGKWTEKNGTATIDNDTMHRYLQSAYYSIEPEDSDDTHVDTIEVNTTEFTGFGNKANPFRGVIVGGLKKRNNATVSTGIVIQNDAGKTIQGLIPYSYGSVVKNLGVTYEGMPDKIAYTPKSDADGVPSSFFGGVIGCILGGDNIIDGVTVSSGTGFSVAAEGASAHLVPVGGYVGAIAGGGVIFRSMAGESWLKADKDVTNSARLYANPYVGRVIDGYAFSEGGTVDNGNKNYKVNPLTDKGTACVETGNDVKKYKGETNSAITTTVKNAQGLLVLSAIISSGAGGGSSYTDWSSAKDGNVYGQDGYRAETDYGSFNGSRAYAGRTTGATGSYLFGNDSLGKVRNAAYDHVGDPSGAAGDFDTSKQDDRLAPGNQAANQAALDQADDSKVNSPYLVKNYATWQTGNVCAPKASGMDLHFAAGTYDMTVYGTGFTGLSGRYYSNACASDYGSDRDRIVPQIACINGNGAKLIIQSDVKQYLDDDYFLQTWGGLFSAVEFTNTSVSESLSGNGGYLVKDLQFGNNAENAKRSSVSLTCIKSDGTEASYADLQSASAVDRDVWNGNMPHMGVGMFAGTAANRDALSGANEGKYKNVSLVNCDVSCESMSGGLFGNSGWAKRRTDPTRNRMISFETQASPVRLYDCAYSDVTVTGATRVGGYVGATGSGSTVGVWATGEDKTFGANSTIKSEADDCVMGGVVGLSWGNVQANVPTSDVDSQSYSKAVFTNVSLQNDGKTNKFGNNDCLGTGGIVGNAKTNCDIRKIKIASGSNASTLIGASNASKGLRCVGGIVGQIDKDATEDNFADIEVNGIAVRSQLFNGGIVGSLTVNATMKFDSIVVDGVSFEAGTGTWDGYCGGVAGQVSAGAKGADISVSNSTVRNVNLNAPHSSTLSADGRGTYRISNVLFTSNKYLNSNNQGVLIGDADASNLKGVFASGISVIPATNADGKNADVSSVICSSGKDSADKVKQINQKSYIAFADYTDQLNTVDGNMLYNDERTEGGSEIPVESASPYATTNPINDKIKVMASASASTKSLFGDGAAIDTAARIKSQAGASVVGRYTYTNIGGRSDDGSYQNDNAYNATTSRTTFEANNTKAETKYTGEDFPVLKISGNDSTTVENYLNLVTNGGFSDARRLNSSSSQFVTATTETFVLSSDGKSFVKSDEVAPSLSVVNSGGSNMLFRASTTWDNDMNRFTLLTVTFKNGSGHTYKVQVPIVVERMLEISFTATYTYGTKFNKDEYANLTNHVLTSVGDAMTGYLTWTYNKDGAGKRSEYGWNSYLESGGVMGPLNKTIEFSGSNGRGTLPEGTQLTLVDPSNNGKEYKYTAGTGGVTSAKLTDFADAEGNRYQEKWLSESMEVKAEKQNGADWVQLPDNATDGEKAAAVAKVDGKYYKRAEATDAGDRYRLWIEGEEPTADENFYLIVRVPANSTTTVNGYTGTAVTTNVNTNINYMQRSGTTDGHQNTASTYSVALSYGQTLVDNKGTTSGDASIAMSPDSDLQYRQMKMSVTDTVVTGQNEYTDNDSLFYQLNSSLVSHDDASVAAGGYPRGTSGDAYFYVKVGDDYYTWSGSGWNEGSGKWQAESWTNVGPTKTPVLGVDESGVDKSTRWSADGNDMRLILCSSDGHPIDLKKIRDLKDSDSFSITMEMDVVMTEPAAVAGIAASQDKGAQTYTKPSYRSFLSTYASSLSTSNMTADNDGGVRYYRESDEASSKISLTASLVSQLGINIDDLKSADGAIALTGRYDFTDAKEGAAKLDAGDEVVYTLTLQRRQDDGSYADMTYGAGDSISNYVEIVSNDQALPVTQNTGSYVFTDTKGGGKFATRDGDSLALVLGFRVKVNTDVESRGQFYSNYRLVLTAHLTGDNVDDTPKNAQGLTGYDNSDYITYALTRVNTSGIAH